jgi:hypothetical protein
MRLLLIILLLILSDEIVAQINVGPIRDVKIATGAFDQAKLNKLKKTTTIFIYRESDLENLEVLKKTLKEAWTYTEMKFVSYDEFLETDYDDSYSFFSVTTTIKVVVTSVTTEVTHIYLTLWMPTQEEEPDYFCRIELYPSFKVLEMMSSTVEVKREIEFDDSDWSEYFYTKADFRNWNLFYLKNSLQFVSGKLKESSEHFLLREMVYYDLVPLTENILYIPDYALIKFSPLNGDESKRHSIDKIFKKYAYPYRVVTEEELTKKVLEATEPVYYLSYVKSSMNKFVTVFNSQTGEMLYSRFNGGYNLNKQDLSDLSDAIKTRVDVPFEK